MPLLCSKPHLLGITATPGYTDTGCGLVNKLPAVALVTTSLIGLNIHFFGNSLVSTLLMH